MPVTPTLHGHAASIRDTYTMDLARRVDATFLAAQGAAGSAGCHACAGGAARKRQADAPDRHIALHPEGLEWLGVALSNGRLGRADRTPRHISAVAPRADSNDELLTDAAKRILPFAYLTAPLSDIPADGTIPQEVLENAVHNHWQLPRAWREYLKLSKLEVATRVDISDSRYAELEVGFLRLNAQSKKKIARSLKLKPAQLLA